MMLFLWSQHHYCPVVHFVQSYLRYPSQTGKDVCSHGHDGPERRTLYILGFF